ncbi:hypothetical protein BKA67DRAFT_645075 [Truncatella angustata]|uniref:Rhodopsin domain-containing protein n=1 Tax=Truncatella angustata TaxID=152316 RepID=A0A9P8UP86_9PEZI|nr:uncharacterized protein BKA67DRAFT_645075 [Truncatella angustata]KAH6655601.1 hypothetical protein BKA67DRAFT_645075 [Truncatella angustata]
MCLLIKAINNHDLMSRANRSLIALTLVSFVSGFTASAFQCRLLTPWTCSNHAQCPSARSVYIYNGAMNIVTDTSICILAFAMIRKFQTTRKRKAEIVALFAFRIMCPITTIPTLQSFDFLYYDTSDASWLALEPAMWSQVPLSLSVITACFPSMKNVFDSFLGNTIAVGIDAPYQLDTVKGKEGFRTTAYASEIKSSTPRSFPNRCLKPTDTAPTQVSYHTGPADLGSDEMPHRKKEQSECVWNRTDGVMAISEVEVQLDCSPRSTSTVSSQSSVYASWALLEKAMCRARNANALVAWNYLHLNGRL